MSFQPNSARFWLTTSGFLASLVASLVASLPGCASGPRGAVVSKVDEGDLEGALGAYERFRELEGGDGALLARVAALLLYREAQAEEGEWRRAAIAQLAYAGTEGLPVLRRLSRLEGDPPARLEALRVLASRGDTDAGLALRGLGDTSESDVLAVAIAGMDPEQDRRLLLGHLQSGEPKVRAAAASRLAPVAEDPEVIAALSEAARVDPEASVRAAAIRSLGRGGEAAFEVLRERLGDPASGARMAAVAALLRADRARALVALGSLLSSAPSPTGVEAARVIALTARTEEEARAEEVSAARAFLRRTLSADAAGLRSQAGIALASLPTPALGDSREEILADLVGRFGQEPEATVRLSLARALLRHEETAEAAEAALIALLGAEGMPRVQAAAMLAGRDHEGARGVLAEYLDPEAGHPPELRRTAVRALAREALRPDAVRRALLDPDPGVRIHAAGGVLAAAAATSR